MPQYERQKSILQYLQSNHSATVKELAAAIYASEASVRRDIARVKTVIREKKEA
jgi:DeoR/GlpR family transcriptional regulator of sugar metabolism